MPTVSWFINERMVEGHLETIGNNVIVNRLEVPGVKREHLNSSYKCQASNTKLMMPVEKTVRLELLCKYIYRKILYAILLNSNKVTLTAIPFLLTSQRIHYTIYRMHFAHM